MPVATTARTTRRAQVVTCHQLMKTEDPAVLDAWFECRRDLIAFHVDPVTASAEVARRIASGPAR
ncbi:DUF3303 family protein [Nocardia sp. CA-151230]|uniref:DUF3303 family protein n=1 Tax=Nocardia sp. CA-151230 TaxID=3239982 RepID=UPI003D8F00AB